MTVATTTNKAIGTGNGLTTTFPFTFGTLPTGDLVVTLISPDGIEEVQTEITDYTVLGEGSEDGGAVVFGVAPPEQYTVLIQRIVPILQPTDYKNQGSFYPRTHERSFDRSVMIDQQLFERVEAAMTLPPQITGVSTTLPAPESNTIFGWNSAGDAITNFPLSDIATNIAYGDKTFEVFAGTGAQTVFPLIRDPGSLGNLDVSIDGVTQVNGTDFTYAGANLTITPAPALDAVILVRYDVAVPVGTALATAVSYTPPQTGVAGALSSFLDSLWTAGANTGAALLRWIQAGAGAIARGLQDKLRAAHLSVEDFGAVGDGATDDYAAIVAAITQAQALGAGTVVHFENATYALGQRLTIQNVPVILRGKGGKHPAYNGAPAATGTSLKYTGAASTGNYFVTCQHMIGLHGLQGISLDCDSKVRGLDIADVYYGEYRDVSIRNMASGTVGMRTGMSASGSTNWNTFDRFSIDAIGAGAKGLHVTGTGVQNTAHNVVRDLQINYSGGATGLHLGYSDNNSFHMVFINRTDGVAGKGVYADPSEDPLFPESNYFFHLQAGQDGWQQPNNTPRNYIYGYDRSNGQPLPSLGATSSLLFFTEGANLWVDGQKFVKDADAWSVSTAITVTANSGTITTVGTKSCRYLVRGKTLYYHINATITTNGTGASYINIGNLPFTPGGTAGFIYMATGRQVGGASSTCYGTLTQGSTTMTVLKYDATYPGGDGITLCLSGQVEIN